MGKLFVGEDGT